jgi:hypothetical protein
MTTEQRLAALHRELDALERRLGEKESEIAAAGGVPAEHEDRIGEIRAGAGALRGKLARAEQSGWDAVKHEAEADWKALTESFDHWVGHVDAEFGGRKG